MKKYLTGKKLFLLLSLLILSMVIFAGCGSTENEEASADVADMVLQSTVIYTVADEEPISGGVAVAGDKILAVGTMEELEPYIGDNTEVVDYGDQMIMPGFVDGHTHSDVANTVIGVDLTGIDDQAIATEKIKEFLAENPDKEFVVGGGWYPATWGGADPDKKYLDEAAADIPVVLWDYNGHAVWVNSNALEMAGIDAAFAKQFNAEKGQEYIVVDDNGEPVGYLKEAATALVTKYMPEQTADDLEKCINVWNQYGVTTVNTMTDYYYDDPYFDMIEQLEDEDRLTARHMVSINFEESEENLQAAKERFNSDMLRLTSLKTFMDGVASDYTASMLENYKDTDKNGGEPYYTAEEVTAIVEKAAANGLYAHFHCCGDKAIRTALDGYEQAVANGVELSPGFSIEHFDTTHPDDINRPAELGISCNVTPDFLDPTGSFDTNPYLQVLDDETAKTLWNYGSLFKSGANVTFGTDSYYSSYNPFVQLYRATERVCNDGKPEGGYLPEEKFEIKDAIQCYTLNSARACGMDEKVGTLEAGKYADIIVLDTNILECTPEELFNAAVDVTYLGGEIIFNREDAE
jgi:predicted amidohydrolase YtcJ